MSKITRFLILFSTTSVVALLFYIYLLPTLAVSSTDYLDENKTWVITRCSTPGGLNIGVDQIIAIPLNSSLPIGKVLVTYRDRGIITADWVIPEGLLVREAPGDGMLQSFSYHWVNTGKSDKIQIENIAFDEIQLGLGSVPPYWVSNIETRYILMNPETIWVNGQIEPVPDTVRSFFADDYALYQHQWEIILSPSREYAVLSYNHGDFLLMTTDLNHYSILHREEWVDLIWDTNADYLIGLDHNNVLSEISLERGNVIATEEISSLDTGNQSVEIALDDLSISQRTLLYRETSESEENRVFTDLIAFDIDTRSTAVIGETDSLSDVHFIDENTVVYWEYFYPQTAHWHRPVNSDVQILNRQTQEIDFVSRRLIALDLETMSRSVLLDPNWIRFGNSCGIHQDFTILEKLNEPM